MHSTTINISNNTLLEKVTWIFEHFKKDGLKIVSKEDADDLKLLKATRNEKFVLFEECLSSDNLYESLPAQGWRL